MNIEELAKAAGFHVEEDGWLWCGTQRKPEPEMPALREFARLLMVNDEREALEEEIENLRTQLYRERQDHVSYVRNLRETAYKIAQERLALDAGRLDECADGVNVVVDNNVTCWCESCDKEANYGLRTRMSVCNVCGDKRCPRAAHHCNECSTMPYA